MPKKEKTLQTNIQSKLAADKATRKIGSTRIAKVKPVIKPTAKLSEPNIRIGFFEGILTKKLEWLVTTLTRILDKLHRSSSGKKNVLQTSRLKKATLFRAISNALKIEILVVIFKPNA